MKTVAKIARFVGPRLFLYGPQIPRYLALVVALFMASSAGAAEIPDPTVTIRVYNYAEVSGGVLRGAEKEASRIFTAAGCLLYTSPSPRDPKTSRMPSSA